jgi:hypothetical protein
LLRKSFRSTQEIVPLRYLMRHREGLVAASSRQIQRMQKVLTELMLRAAINAGNRVGLVSQ